MINQKTNTRTRSGRTSTSHSRGRYYPRHFTVNGRPFIAKVAAIKHVPSETHRAHHTETHLDELKVGDEVVVGDRDGIQVTVNGEKYLIAYRNRTVKIKI